MYGRYEILLCEHRKHWWYGILQTPCFPASLYVGPVVRYGKSDGKEWGTPASNDATAYHHTQEDALRAFLLLVGG